MRVVATLEARVSTSLRDWTGRVARVLSHVARDAAASICCHQRQYITLARLGGPPPADLDATPPDARLACMVVDSLEAFHGVMREIPAAFRDSVDELARRVAHGCVLCLVRRDDGETGHEVIAYEIAERGVFSALGRRRPVASDIIFSHYVEVLPAWRGRGIHRCLFATRDAYFRERGGRLVCGVVAPQNRASLRALRRADHAVVGSVVRVSLGRDLFVWDTPWQHIVDALQSMETAGGRVWWRLAARLLDREAAEANGRPNG